MLVIRPHQYGFALISALLMVLTVAILGVAVGQQVVTARKVSTINYDNTISNNNAQSALSEGLSVLEENALDPNMLASIAVDLNMTSSWWRLDSNWSLATKLSAVSVGEPMYLIEDAGSDGINLEMDDTGKIERRFYRVTAKAHGRGSAQAFLQSYYVTVE